MKRRDLFRISTAMGLGAALPALAQAGAPAAAGPALAGPLKPPAQVMPVTAAGALFENVTVAGLLYAP